MQDYPSFTHLNSYDLEVLSNYSQMPAVKQWPTQQPIASLAAEAEINNADDDVSGSVMDCLMTLGLIMFLLLSSSMLLGFAADRLTQGMIMLMQQQAKSEIVVR